MGWLTFAVGDRPLDTIGLAAILFVLLGLFFGFNWWTALGALAMVIAVNVFHPGGGGASSIFRRIVRPFRQVASYTPPVHETTPDEPPPYPPRR
ncbi:MAG TPA: hypothetical protein VKA21_15545 [Candidatus Binatia bacterium]|nr:hypothetical protein [Candidatus Binatia bacterium]